MNNSAMNFDIKALLTLLLLKSGTSSRDIQTAVNLTAAARLMVAEEYADSAAADEAAMEGGNVTKIRTARTCSPISVKFVMVTAAPATGQICTLSSGRQTWLRRLARRS